MAGKQRYSDEIIIKALKATKGMVFLAAKKVGCDPDTIHIRARKSDAVRKCIEAQRGEFVDIGEQKLRAGVMKGEQWAVSLLLKTLGRDRGYVEKTEQETTHKGNVNHTHAVKDPLPAPDGVRIFLAGLLSGPPAAPGAGGPALPADGGG